MGGWKQGLCAGPDKAWQCVLLCTAPADPSPPPPAPAPQVMKIAVAPTVIALELVMFRRVPPARIVASVMVVCMGIGVATVTDTQVREEGKGEEGGGGRMWG